jgi:hypothetical protein
VRLCCIISIHGNRILALDSSVAAKAEKPKVQCHGSLLWRK